MTMLKSQDTSANVGQMKTGQIAAMPIEKHEARHHAKIFRWLMQYDLGSKWSVDVVLPIVCAHSWSL